MINIDELRQRVEDAEHRFGAIDERQKAYSSRLSSMIEAIDARQQDSETRLRDSENALRRAKDENEQLRSLLHQLLMAIDGAGRDYLKSPVSELTDRLGVLAKATSEAADAVGDGAQVTPEADTETPETPEGPATDEVAVEPAATASEATEDSASVREILQRMNVQVGGAEAS